ncbi:MAG: Zinc ribbon domain protein [Syntrophaceae bacterium PtaU1.Bin231]|nr:MAG: Zinc ribbon domain protein [Syntrophaceae bacterium PtaU1.Bin231]
MPTYEYICMDCREKMEVFASIAAKEKGLDLVCPKCGGKKLIQFFGQMNIGSARGAMGGMGGCGPSSGAGCCG